jgi:S-adenosylmethionine decarboxylase
MLRSTKALERVFDALVADLGLHPVREIVWQRFPEPGGVTGFLLLSESHIACHTFPERRFAAFDLYCCRPRREWPWSERLCDFIGAERVDVRCIERGVDTDIKRDASEPADRALRILRRSRAP